MCVIIEDANFWLVYIIPKLNVLKTVLLQAENTDREGPHI